MKNKKNIICLLILISFAACKVDPKISAPLPLPAPPSTELAQVVPENWPQPKYKFEENPISEDRFILGRALFYEPMLSKNDSVSCGSCHQNFVAFANAGHRLSHGVHDLPGNRNSPGIFNVAWHPYFMHDGGINHIELQPLGPISNPVEMAENINNVIAKLNASKKYKELFKKAYGDEEVNSQYMLKSMAQFMGLMQSYNSKFDHYKRRDQPTELSDAELRGYDLFIAKCNSCHKEPLFSDFLFRNNGLEVDALLKDSGRAHITGLPGDRYKFKTPSLRNVAITQPYMHDGRYATLEECLDHYTGNIKNTTNLDPILQGGLLLSPQDKQDIISFLHTLTDFEFIKDKRFADPNF